MSEGIEYMGAPQWQVVLCLAAAWTLTFLALSKGVKSTGKVSLELVINWLIISGLHVQMKEHYYCHIQGLVVRN